MQPALQTVFSPLLEIIAAGAAVFGAAEIPPEAAGPTWGLAAACAGFLGAIAWAVRWGLAQAVDLSKAVTGEVLKPVASAHIDLMRTLQKTLGDQADKLDAVAAAQQKLAETTGALASSLSKIDWAKLARDRDSGGRDSGGRDRGRGATA